jgi:uroporphyrinogen decarboxylase
MNSRERILSSINHVQPDQVPVDLGSTPSSGISAMAYTHLKSHLGLTGHQTLVYDVIQQLAEPEDEILDLFGVDVVDLGRAFNTDTGEWYTVALQDGSPAKYPQWFKPVRQSDGSWLAFSTESVLVGKMPAQGMFFDQTTFPYLQGYPDHFREMPSAMNQVIWSALVHSPWDHAAEPGFWQRLRQETLRLRETTDRAILIVCGCNLFEWGTFLRRIDNFLMDIYTEPKSVERLLDALMAIHLQTLEKVCAAVGDIADIIRFGDDLGMDSGGFMGPEYYRRIFKPRHQKHSQMKTFLHSCGSIAEIIPDLIEAGYDILNPIQTQCRGMEPERLKREFGRDITFWGGGSDTRNILNRGSIADVKEDVKRRLEILTPGGGYIFNPIHNILPDVPPENIIALFEAVKEFAN